jgi:hypothetical protein
MQFGLLGFKKGEVHLKKFISSQFFSCIVNISSDLPKIWENFVSMSVMHVGFWESTLFLKNSLQ